MRNNISYIKSLYRTSPGVLIFIIYGLLYDSVINIYKPFGTKFLERIGGTDFHFALYNSMPGFVAIIALIPGSVFMSRFRSKKNIISALFLVSRLTLIVLALIPTLPADMQPILFVTVLSLMNFPDSISQTGLQSFMGNVLPDRTRSQAIALRNKFGNFIVPVVTLITGLIISFLPADDAQRLLFYQAFFIIAFIVGLVEIYVFRKFNETPPEHIPRINIGVFKTIIRDKKFFRYLLTTMLLQFVWQMGWHLGSLFQIRNLHADEIWLALIAVSAGLTGFFSAGFWSKFIHKHGNNKAQVMSGLLMGLNIIFMAVSPNLPVLLLVAALIGIANLGINTTLFNGLLNATPNENRLMYLGFYNTFVNLSLFISPLVGNVFLGLIGLVPTLLLIGVFRISASVILYFFGLRDLSDR